MFSYIKSNKVLLVLSFSLTLLFSCGGGGSDEDDPYIPPVIPPVDTTVITPSDLSLNITIVGVDADNPNGDGSGKIQCIASATDAVKYSFRFGTGDEIESATGNAVYSYDQKGNNNYTVYVYAYSKTGHSISTSKNITIYVEGMTFDKLVFSDEFDVTGSPDNAKWNYDLGNGQGGWGNNEVQYYTNRTDNVKIEDGLLKITAKKESYQGFEYTSTRMKTQGKFSFTYGKVEVRAKLPSGRGTWPAIWMLGNNITTAGWPACGEVDIMEYVGYEPNVVHSAIHTTSSSGNTINHHSYDLETAEEEFHLYSIEWTSTEIKFFVDETLHYTYKPSVYNNQTWPFTENQFLILNLAIGGNWGGVQGVDDSIFPQQFIIDYVRVYQ